MKTTHFFRTAAILLMGVAAAFYLTACGRQESGLESEAGVNLAIVAQPSGSLAAADTALPALNDGRDPSDSQDRRHGSYRIWYRTPDTQWVQYDWSRPISTDRTDVYWMADQRRVYPPNAYRLLYWDGAGFVPVNNPSGLGVAENQYNSTAFEEVQTTKLRLEIDSDAENAAGILEWKVFDSGKSPDFAPLVDAGIDRVVVQGGKTYLAGKIKALKRRGDPDLKVAWSKESGRGRVTFEDEGDPATTATFSEAGDYVLGLTAEKGSLKGSSTLNVKVEAPPPPTPLEPIHTLNFRIDNPLWNQSAKALIVNWIPHCIDTISDPELKEGGMNNIIDAADKLAGKPHGRHRGYVFSNAWVFNTIEAMCVALMMDPQGDQEIIAAQNKMRATLEEWIPKILAAQEPDGYFQTAFTLPRERARDDSPMEHWTRRGDHEGYVAGYFLEAGVAHHLATGGKDLRLYNAAKKLADCWDANIGPAPKKEWYDGHQAMEIALVRFGRFVNEVEGEGQGRKYIALSKFLLDSRKEGSEYDQSHVPVIQQYEAVGHAVRASYSYAGMADIALETGDIDYQSAAKSIWDNIVHRKYYITGGIGSGESSEGFGPDYSLRNNAYCESCSICGEVFFQHRMNRLYHDARYADLYEDTLYNALLGSMDLDGKNFYYQNPLDARGSRYDWHVCPCCVGNIPRTLLSLPTWIYLKDADSIYVNLFIGSTATVEDVAGADVEIVQATDYPWSGSVAITVNPASPAKFSVKVRVPDRDVSDLYTAVPNADGVTSMAVNGSPITPTIEKGYAVITRDWKAGDRIDLELPMQIQRVKADERITADIDRVALRYGPLVYSAERVDQDIDQVLSPESVLSTEWKGGLLGGVMVIKGTWADGSAFLAIPNYARANREDDEDTAAEARDRRSLPVSSIVWVKDK